MKGILTWVFVVLVPSLRAGIVPDPILTPGDTVEVSTQELCQPGGYTAKARHVTMAEKKAVFREYGIPWEDRGKYEVDHFLAITTGGSNDIKNLWPERYEPRPGAHEKDIVEYKLHLWICSDKIGLSEAQEILRTDWYGCYKTIQKGGVCHDNPK